MSSLTPGSFAQPGSNRPPAAADPACRLWYACLYEPPLPGGLAAASAETLLRVAREFSPRYEQHGADLVSIDVSGLDRLLGSPRTIGEELRRDAADRGLRVHVAVAATRMAALVLALARPGVTIVNRGREAATLALMPIGLLEKIDDPPHRPGAGRPADLRQAPDWTIAAVKHWGIRTLGELAALPPADLAARLGAAGPRWQAIARGEDIRPLVPTQPDERFDASLELEWPIEGLEPLSFVLTRLLEPISTRLERRDRGAAGIYVDLRLVTKEGHARHLQLPSPTRDVRTLRTLALLDLESHPPAAAIDRVTVTIDPTPARVLQHTLFTRAHPTPDQLATLLARLGALMGADRLGAAAPVDSYRPGAFAMTPFATEHPTASSHSADANPQAAATLPVTSALRRCRPAVPARVAVAADQRPVRVTTDRRGFAGGAVVSCAGPWRSSGEWWADQTAPAAEAAWNRDEWDVGLTDGGVYRIFRDRATDHWFIDAIVD